MNSHTRAWPNTLWLSKFAAELGCLAPAFLQTYCEADGQTCKSPFEQKSVLDLAETFGAVALADRQMQAVGSLLPNMIEIDHEWKLWKIIRDTKGKTFEQVRFAGTNAAMLLNVLQRSFVGKDLADTLLISAELFDVDLTDADCHKAKLRGSILFNPTLANTNLIQSDLEGVTLVEYLDVNSVAFSSDERKLLVASEDGSIRIWNIDTVDPVVLVRSQFDDSHAARRERSMMTWIARYSPDNNWVAAGRGSEYGVVNGEFLLWDVRTGHRMIDERIDLGVNDIVFSPNGRYVILGCGDEFPGATIESAGLTAVWDLLENKKVQMLEYDALVWGVSYDPNQQLIASARDDGQVEILRADTLTPCANMG